MAAGAHLTHTRFIVNPASRSGKTGRTWSKLWQIVQQVWPHSVDFQLTQRPGHGIDLARQAAGQGVTTVIAVGGDGTVNEVVNGLLTAPEISGTPPVLGILELGTGGDFARTLRMPRNPRAALEWLLSAVPIPCDVGKAVCRSLTGETITRYFINILDFGLGGAVVQWVNTHSKRLGGKVTFLAGILVTLATYRNKTIRFRIDGGAWQEQKMNNFIVANGRYFGGGLFPAPMASVQDGQLEGIIIGDVGRWEAVGNLGRIRKGTHLLHPKITHWPLHQLEAESPETVYVDADGELIGTLPLKLQVVPGAISVLQQR